MTDVMSYFFDLSNDMIGIFRLDWRPEKLNQAWSRVLGWSMEELYDRPFNELIHSMDFENLTVELPRILQGESIRNFLVRYQCKNGGYKYLSWNFQVDVDGQLVIAVVRDTTPKKIFAALSKQVNTNPRIGTWSFDLLTQEVFWSKSMYDLYEVTADAYDPRVHLGMNFILEEDRQELQIGVDKLLAFGAELDLTVRSKTAKGTEFYARFMGTADSKDGKIVQAYGTAYDATGERLASKETHLQQELLQFYLKSIPAAVYVKDLDGRYLVVNPTFENMAGKKLSEFVGKSDSEVFSAEVAKVLQERDEAVLKSGVGCSMEADLNIPDKGVRHYLSERFPLRDEQGHIVAIAGVATDITKIHEFQHELQNAKELAEAAARAKSEFLANMSHEIRTPMNSMQGMIEVLMDTELNDDQKKYVDVLGRASSSLLNLLNDILDISKIESGYLRLEKAPFNIRELLYRCIELLNIKAVEKGLYLTTKVAPELPEVLIGDAARVQQVVLNLLGNGLKFTNQGGVHLTASIQGEYLHIQVQDTGIGISSEQMPNVFERFIQGDSSITRRFGGSGLGLSISKQLVEKMGGTIRVESHAGQGTCFSFTVPVMLTQN